MRLRDVQMEAGGGALGVPPAPRADSGPRWPTLLLAALLTILAALPILLVETPPIFDYPNHLARVHILANLDRVPAFAAHFSADTLLLPNVLADMILLALEPLAGVEAAGKVLVLLLLALTVGGALALGAAAFGRLSPWPLLAAALAWNEVLMWGFLNYALGIALLLWGLAAWLRFERTSRPWQLASAALFGLLLFLAHMVAFGLFAVAVAVVELARAWRHRRDGVGRNARRLALSAAVFLPALALFLAVSPASGLPLDIRFIFTAWQKLSPFTRLLSTSNTGLDVATLAAITLAVAGLLASRRVRLHGPLALVALVFALMVLTLPYTAMGSYFLDMRVAIAAALVLVAALVPARPSRRLAGAVLAGLVVLVGVRSAAMAQDWMDQDRAYAAVRATLERLPRGAILIPAEAVPFELGDWTTTRRFRPAHEHTASVAVIARDAVVPNVFARKGQNPLVFTPAADSLQAVALNPVARVGTPPLLRRFIREVDDAVRDIHAMPGAAGTGVYVILFNRGCGEWPRGLPAAPVACEADHALMRMLPPKPDADEGILVGSSS